jgi:hypothetical protein
VGASDLKGGQQEQRIPSGDIRDREDLDKHCGCLRDREDLHTLVEIFGTARILIHIVDIFGIVRISKHWWRSSELRGS